MIILRNFQSLSHKEVKYFHVPHLRGLDWGSGCRRGLSNRTDRHGVEKLLQLSFLLRLKERWGKEKWKLL